TGLTLLVAVTVRVYVPSLPTTGVPARVAVPLPLLVKLTPAGRAPDSARLGAGKPVVVIVKEPAPATTKVAPGALVMAGACWTVSVKVCVASGVTPLLAVISRLYFPPLLGAGVPASVAVPSWWSVKLTPPGSAPLALSVVALGKSWPVVTVKLPAEPTVNC